MRELLEAQITKTDFDRIWEIDSPPYGMFLDDAAARISKKLSEPVEHISAAIKFCGNNRARIDGNLKTRGGEKNYYVELVWLPKSKSYRGEASVSEKAPEPEPKSVDDFITALNGITGEEELIFVGQAHYAVEGVDEEAEGLSRAYPALFALFERFPDEDFGNPGVFVHLMESRGGFEKDLELSLARTASVPAVVMANRLLHKTPAGPERQRWMEILRLAARSANSSREVRDLAAELLEYQESRGLD